MSIWDDPKFFEPTDAVGDWQFASSACFEHEHAPTAMKNAIERMTMQLLQREPQGTNAAALRRDVARRRQPEHRVALTRCHRRRTTFVPPDQRKQCATALGREPTLHGRLLAPLRALVRATAHRRQRARLATRTACFF